LPVLTIVKIMLVTAVMTLTGSMTIHHSIADVLCCVVELIPGVTVTKTLAKPAALSRRSCVKSLAKPTLRQQRMRLKTSSIKITDIYVIVQVNYRTTRRRQMPVPYCDQAEE
jgi:hypothetical protein